MANGRHFEKSKMVISPQRFNLSVHLTKLAVKYIHLTTKMFSESFHSSSNSNNSLSSKFCISYDWLYLICFLRLAIFVRKIWDFPVKFLAPFSATMSSFTEIIAFPSEAHRATVTGDINRKFGEIWTFVSEICERRDKQADIETR